MFCFVHAANELNPAAGKNTRIHSKQLGVSASENSLSITASCSEEVSNGTRGGEYVAIRRDVQILLDPDEVQMVVSAALDKWHLNGLAMASAKEIDRLKKENARLRKSIKKAQAALEA